MDNLQEKASKRDGMKDYSPLHVDAIFSDPVISYSNLIEDSDFTKDRINDFLSAEERNVNVPFGMIDSIFSSALHQTPSLGFHALLSRACMASLEKSSEDLNPFRKDFDYLMGGIRASSKVNIHLFAYLPGKCGCHVELCLGDGTRRFSTAYHMLLLGLEKSRKIECKIQNITFLDVPKVQELRDRLQKKLERKFSILGLVDKVKNLLSRNNHYSKDDEISKAFKMYKQIKAIEAAIDYQERSEPVMREILAVLQGKATSKDYRKIYESFKPWVED